MLIHGLLTLAIQAAALPATAVAAVQPPASAPQTKAAPVRTAPARTARVPFYTRLKQRGLSDAAIAIVRASEAKQSAETQRATAALRSSGQDLRAILGAPTLDTARLGDALRRRDTARAAIAAARTAALVDALQALPAREKPIFLRALGMAPPAPAPAPARP
jgi:hypothetical protein